MQLRQKRVGYATAIISAVGVLCCTVVMSQTPQARKIAGYVVFANGGGAPVEIWLKSESGRVSTRITRTDSKGYFEFVIPPPNAQKFKLLVHPYGYEYEHLAPINQSISIIVPGKDSQDVKNYAYRLQGRDWLTRMLVYDEFVNEEGAEIEANDEASNAILTTVKAELLPLLKGGYKSFTVEVMQEGAIRPWFKIDSR